MSWTYGFTCSKSFSVRQSFWMTSLISPLWALSRYVDHLVCMRSAMLECESKSSSWSLQKSYRIRSLAFGQNWHLDALSDTTDMARRSTMGRSANVSEGTSFASEIDRSNSIMTLAQG